MHHFKEDSMYALFDIGDRDLLKFVEEWKKKLRSEIKASLVPMITEIKNLQVGPISVPSHATTIDRVGSITNFFKRNNFAWEKTETDKTVGR